MAGKAEAKSGSEAVVYDFEAYRTAKRLLDRHGVEALAVAALRAEAMQERGDKDGRATWLRILDAVWEMSRKQPRVGAAA